MSKNISVVKNIAQYESYLRFAGTIIFSNLQIDLCKKDVIKCKLCCVMLQRTVRANHGLNLLYFSKLLMRKYVLLTSTYYGLLYDLFWLVNKPIRRKASLLKIDSVQNFFLIRKTKSVQICCITNFGRVLFR